MLQHFGYIYIASACKLKEQSRPSVSNVRSTDIRLTTFISAKSLVNVMVSV